MVAYSHVGSPTTRIKLWKSLSKEDEEKKGMDIFNTKFDGEELPGKALFIRMDRAVRSSGLLAFLTPEELQTVIALFTFVDESGRCRLSSRTLAQTLNLSESQAQKRLRKLCQIRWRNRPLVVRENDRDAGQFVPGSYRIMEVEGLLALPDGTRQPAKGNHGGSSRDSVDAGASSHVSSSGDGSKPEGVEGNGDAIRRQAGKADIGKRMPTTEAPYTSADNLPPDKTRITGNSCVVAGNINKEHTTEDKDGAANTDKRKRILRELLRYGVSGSTASQMLDRYPIERISEQLEMLPFRNAKEPAAMLVKAIRDDWAAPATYISRQRKETERKTKAERETKEAERRRNWQKQVAAAKSKLPREELQRITRIAREKMQRQLGGAFHGDVPERLVNIEVNRIIAEKYIEHDKT